MALGKTCADRAANALEAGHGRSVATIWSAWVHSRTTLLAANGPTMAMMGDVTGRYENATAMLLAQACALGVLLFYRRRIGWRITSRMLRSGLGAVSMGAAGLALTALKHAVH